MHLSSQMSSGGAAGDSQLCGDVALLGALHAELYSRLHACALWPLYTRLELPLCALLAALELRGIAVDTRVMQRSCDLLKVQTIAIPKKTQVLFFLLHLTCENASIHQRR